MCKPDPLRAASLFLAVLFFQFTFASGRLYSFDEVVLLETAENLVNRGSAALDETPEVRLYATPGRDGRLYSKFGIGMSGAIIPFYIFGKGFGILLQAVGWSSLNLASFASFTASFTNAFFVALTAFVVFKILRDEGISESASAQTALLLVTATTLAVYGRGLFADALTALGIALLWRMYRLDRPLLAGFAAALVFSARLEYAVLLGIFPFFLGFRRGARFLLSGGFVLALLGLYNLVRFGNPLNQGQLGNDPADSFSTPILIGLVGLILSPGKGLLWYSPPVVLALAGWKKFRHRFQRDSCLLLFICMVLLVIHAKWASWMGGWSYGPRRLVALLPLVMLPAAWGIEGFLKSSKGRRGLAVITVMGLAVQLPGLTVDFMAYLKTCPGFSSSLWSLRYSAIIGQSVYLFDTGDFDLWYYRLFGGRSSVLGMGLIPLALSYFFAARAVRENVTSTSSS